jgi:hypothetical protein
MSRPVPDLGVATSPADRFRRTWSAARRQVDVLPLERERLAESEARPRHQPRYRRIMWHRDHKKAIIAVAHAILVTAYY